MYDNEKVLKASDHRDIVWLGAQVAVEGKGWMILAIDNYDYGIF